MKWRNWIENWDMSSLRITAPFLEMEWNPKDEDKAAAWELYIELLTRIAIQPLDDFHGDEKTALESISSLFSITRQVIKENGRGCIEFTKIAVVILNQAVRPFTAKWHKLSIDSAFDDQGKCKEFRGKLRELQSILRRYAKMLADMAGVEDLTSFEVNSLHE